MNSMIIRHSFKTNPAGPDPRLSLRRMLPVLALALASGTALGEESPALEAFDSCSSFTAYMQTHAKEMLGPWGLTGGPELMYRNGVVDMPVAVADANGTAPGSTPAFSDTNVQEAGVDEPDIVKTDGRTIFTIAQGRLQAVDVRGGKPALLGSLDVGGWWGQQLILHEGRLVVISSGWGGGMGDIAIMPGGRGMWWGEPRTTLTEIDVSDPSAMRVREVLELEGQYLSARRVGAALRVVVRSNVKGPAMQYPSGTSGWEQARAAWHNRYALENSSSSDWMPTYTLRNLRNGREVVRAMSRCTQTYAPSEFAGLGNITVLTLSLGRGLTPVDTDSILSDGDTVYASGKNLYVATRQWQDPAETADPASKSASVVNTEVHRFDISEPGQTRYVGSGAVDGYLLSQWSMSEHEGDLRVVSTDEPPWWGDAAALSQTRVTVLREQDGKLAPIGSVDGLGLGERVYAVRFIGPLGYVVTFRQVDPLYVIDASDPTAPRVRGELKIPGYSAYLHPVGEGLLLGIGRSATPEGRVLGVQASLFDVSNPDQPLALTQLDLGYGWTESEFDHHAFLYWPATRQALIPVESWVEDSVTGRYEYDSSAVGLAVGSTTLSENGRIRHEIAVEDPEQPLRREAIRRTLVVGDTLYSLSDSGLKASDLETLEERAWMPFPPPPTAEPPEAP